MILGILLLVAIFAVRAGDWLWYLERGWVLVLGAWSVLLACIWPRGRFVSRALAAVAGATASVTLLFLINRGGFAHFDAAMADRLQADAAATMAALSSGPGMQRFADTLREVVQQGAELQARLYPAWLALASMAALAVAWWAYRRLAHRDPRPLAPLREFRFSDELVWLVIAGVALLLLPLPDAANRAGSNLLLFMAALYALRGLAVLLVLGRSLGPVALVVGGVLLVLLNPVGVVTTIVVGLSDTWLDIRNRWRTAAGSGA